MKRYAAPFAVLLGCAACGQAAPAAEPVAEAAEQASAEPFAEFERVAVPDTLFDNPLDAVAAFAQFDPFEEPGPVLQVEARATDGETVRLTFSVTGYADDSVQGERWQVDLRQNADGWRAFAAGRQVMCWRGANAGIWKLPPCL